MFSFAVKKRKVNDDYLYTVIKIGYNSVSLGVFSVVNEKPVMLYQAQKFLSGFFSENIQRFNLLLSLLDNILATTPSQYANKRVFVSYDPCWVFSTVRTFFAESRISNEFSLRDIESNILKSAQNDMDNFFSTPNLKRDFFVLEKKIANIHVDELPFEVAQDTVAAKTIHISYFICAVDNSLHTLLTKKIYRYFSQKDCIFTTYALPMYVVSNEILSMQNVSNSNFNLINISEGSTSSMFNTHNMLVHYGYSNKGLNLFLDNVSDEKIYLSEMKLIASQKIKVHSNYSVHAKLHLRSQVWFDEFIRQVNFLKHNFGSTDTYVLCASLDAQDWFRFIVNNHDKGSLFQNTLNSRVIIIDRNTIGGLVLSKIENPITELLCLGWYYKLLTLHINK